MQIKKWVLKKADSKRSEQLQRQYSLSTLAADVLAARELTQEQAKDLFEGNALESPFSLIDMKPAVDRIQIAIEKEQTIAVYGDYDCDGICASTILSSYLISIGANVITYIPERSEGYGLSFYAVDQLKSKGVNLIITVDNGISALEEADYIAKCGIDLIITDHHQVGDCMPSAIAVIDPHRPDCNSSFKDLCGTGVAFKLIAALENEDYDTVFDFAGDLTAIATIADIVPLIGENRTIVLHGLQMLKITNNVGLHTLIEIAGIRNVMSATSVAFGICPRINAAGRLDKAKDAFALLNCEDEKEAEKLAMEICSYNSKRKQLEEDILKQTEQTLSDHPEQSHRYILVAYGKNWKQGVIGIAAGKLSQKYNRPAIVLSIDEDGQAVGSMRSAEGFSVFKALQACSEHLIKWGGHEQAGGLTLAAENIDKFFVAINNYAQKNPPSHFNVSIDLAVSPEQLMIENVKQLQNIAPFGCKNPRPIFLIQNAYLEEILPLSGGKHLRLNFKIDNHLVSTVYFNMPLDHFYYKIKTVFHLLVSLEVNSFRNVDRVDIHILDLRPARLNQKAMISAADHFDRFIRGESIPNPFIDVMRPTRAEFAAVYKLITKVKVFFGDAPQLFFLIFQSKINYCKLCMILQVLQESGLIVRMGNEIRCVGHPAPVDLEKNRWIEKLNDKKGSELNCGTQP